MLSSRSSTACVNDNSRKKICSSKVKCGKINVRNVHFNFLPHPLFARNTRKNTFFMIFIAYRRKLPSTCSTPFPNSIFELRIRRNSISIGPGNRRAIELSTRSVIFPNPFRIPLAAVRTTGRFPIYTSLGTTRCKSKRRFNSAQNLKSVRIRI